MKKLQKVNVHTTVKASIEKVWTFWTEPKHIKIWNAASTDWHTTFVENDLNNGGKFIYRMEAKDGSFGFDFSGTYEIIEKYKFIKFKLDDGREVSIYFINKDGVVEIYEEFEAESSNSLEQQKTGWQAILNSFKNYIEIL